MNLKNNIKGVALGLIIILSASYVFAATFTGPACPPPECNTDAPLNVGVSSQDKLGPLRINTNTVSPVATNGLYVHGIARFWNGFVIENRTSDPTTNLDTGRMWLIN